MIKTFVMWLGIIFVLSVYPFDTSNVSVAHADKLLHAVLYAITCALFYSSLKTRAGHWALALSVLLATGYGVLMELAQYFIASRTFSGYDALANFAGALVAAALIWTNALRHKKGGG